MVNIEINGQKIEARVGAMVIEAADDAGIYIPRFCYHKKLSIAANCRMCLIEIEKVGKPLPACATPVTDGMKVFTKSTKAINAQKGVMEFLLINHPLDCPICDQGGECELQDVAVGYGGSLSQYGENKRVVIDKNLGPLIATDMTRCIHCTRCVRFGEEIAGLRELGATGRGEHMEIGTYIEKSIVSELSGNVIDVCPVGALTAKPSRYTARPWELTQHAAISAHDCVGSNTWVHTRSNTVIRVVPRENESINESWISDRDRFSYTAVKSEQRLTQPLLREAGELKPVDWETALNAAAEMMNQAGDSLATLISPQATLEEQYLAQKLTRAQGSANIDHRLTQVDFSAEQEAPIMPWLGRSLASLETLDAGLIVAGNLRYQQPLLSHRLRKAANNNAAISSIGHTSGQYNFALQHELAGSASRIIHDLAAVALALVEISGKALTPHLAKILKDCKIGDSHRAIAASLSSGSNSAVIVGTDALANPQLALLQEICEAITTATGSTLGYLSESANSAGACLAGALPHRGPAGVEVPKVGENAAAIISASHKLLLTFALNPLLDTPATVRLADSNESIIAISCFDNEFVQQQADLVLPLAAVLESSGSFVNAEGLWQSFKGCVKSRGDSRQGWKILSALGQVLHPGEFDYADSVALRSELKALCSDVALSNLCGIKSNDKKLPKATGPEAAGQAEKIGFTPIYASDDMTRLSAALQATPLMRMQSSVTMNREMAGLSKLLDSDQVQIKQGKGTAVLPLRLDEGVPDGCVYIPGGIEAVRYLADAFGKISLEKVS
jgi:NADH-quinone oxidoreductase subunit G